MLQIVDWKPERPCPQGRTQVAPGDDHGSETHEFPGLDVPGKGHFVGGSVSLFFVPPETCRRFCFIQAVKRTITLDGVIKTNVSHDWQLDLTPDQPRRPPCYKIQRVRPEGGTILRDTPGLINPWSAMKLPDGSIFRPRPGQRLVGLWEFHTWAVCLNRSHVYGEFTWTLRIEFVVPAGPPPQGARIPGATANITGPDFSAAAAMPQADTQLLQALLK